MVYYKAKVTEVCEQYDEITIALLDEKVPGAYTYLQKRDYDWIRSKVVFDNERRFRRERENLLLTRLREIIATFEDDGYPDEQLSYGFIANLIGSTRDELRHRMSPNSELRSLLDEIVEHRKTWKQERAARITERFSRRETLLLSRLHEIIATFDVEGYPDKQLSVDSIASRIDSTRDELRNKMRKNSELQNFLDTIVEHRGTWRQERTKRIGGCRSKREITLQSVIEQISANPPEQQISYKYIAKMAGLKKDVLRDSPNLLELVDGIVESKDDWPKRRFIAAYHSRPISVSPCSVREICKVASFDIATYKKHRKVFEKILETLYAQIINRKGDTPKDE